MADKQSDTVTMEIPRSMLRYFPVEPTEFLKLKQELGLTNKECADAIGRTVSRVSELTHSKGASRAIYETVEPKWRAFAEAKAAKAAEAPAAE